MVAVHKAFWIIDSSKFNFLHSKFYHALEIHIMAIQKINPNLTGRLIEF